MTSAQFTNWDTNAPTRVTNPVIPYAADIPDGIWSGRVLVIQGAVIASSEQRRFNIDFACGRLVNGDHRDNIALHLNPRFDKTNWLGMGDNQIVMNTLVNNRWDYDKELRTKNPLKIGDSFKLRIQILENYYKITLNDKHLADYIHRIPIEKIVCLYIDGNVRIESIDYEGSPRSSSMSSSSSSNSNGAKKIRPHFASNVRTPYELTLISGGGFVPPRLLSLVAVAPIRGRRFEVNFKINHEYLFHFRVDLLSLSTPRGAIVRNSTQYESWLEEEREIPFWPFTPEQPFTLNIKAHAQHAEVSVDGRLLVIFRYRSNLNPSEATAVSVDGDVNIQRFEAANQTDLEWLSIYGLLTHKHSNFSTQAMSKLCSICRKQNEKVN